MNLNVKEDAGEINLSSNYSSGHYIFPLQIFAPFSFLISHIMMAIYCFSLFRLKRSFYNSLTSFQGIYLHHAVPKLQIAQYNIKWQWYLPSSLENAFV